MSQPLRVGIAGYGIVGKRRHQFIDLRDDMKVVAMCDQVYDGDGVLDNGIAYHQTADKVLEHDLDVLFVCLSNDVAADVTIKGLEHGLHVFCEKPPGRDVPDIERVIATADQHPNLRLKYGFNHRYHDSIRDALALVRSGELGRMINMRGVYGKSQVISYGQTTWRTKRELAGGGILLDQGIHMVDLMRLFAGDFEDIHSFVRNDFWNHDVEDNAYAMMRTKDGIIAMLHSSATQWRHSFRLEMAMEKGAITLSGILSGSKSYGAETLNVAYAEDESGDPREETTRYNKDPSWADEIADFAECISADRAITEGSADEALKTMQLVYRIYCADPEWKAKWDLKDPND